MEIRQIFKMKSILLLVTWICMSLTCFFERRSFIAHVFGVTFLLLVVLYNVNGAYGIFENKFQIYMIIVMAGGVIHCSVPVVSLFYGKAIYAHIGICFMVHVLHLGQSYMVINDMNLTDKTYQFLLWLINILELGLNLAYAFPTVISSHGYVICALIVEMGALMIASIKLSRKQKESPTVDVVTIEEGNAEASNNNHVGPSIFEMVGKGFLKLMSDRIFMVLLSCAFVLLAWIFPSYQYAIICTVLPLYCTSLFAKLHFQKFLALWKRPGSLAIAAESRKSSNSNSGSLNRGSNRSNNGNDADKEGSKVHFADLSAGLTMAFILSVIGWLVVTKVIPVVAGTIVNIVITALMAAFVMLQTNLLNLQGDSKFIALMFCVAMIAVSVLYLIFQSHDIEDKVMLMIISLSLSSSLLLSCAVNLKAKGKNRYSSVGSNESSNNS